MAQNPYFVAAPPPISDSVRQHLRTLVTTYLQLPSVAALVAALTAAGVPPAVTALIGTLQTMPDAALQALHPALADPTVWALVKKDLGL